MSETLTNESVLFNESVSNSSSIWINVTTHWTTSRLYISRLIAVKLYLNYYYLRNSPFTKFNLYIYNSASKNLVMSRFNLVNFLSFKNVLGSPGILYYILQWLSNLWQFLLKKTMLLPDCHESSVTYDIELISHGDILFPGNPFTSREPGRAHRVSQKFCWYQHIKDKEQCPHKEQEKALKIDCWQHKVYKSISTATSLTTKPLSPGANPLPIYHSQTLQLKVD